MSKGKQKVMINLETTIDDGGEKEHHSMKQVGHFLNRGKLDVITFSETTDDGETIHHLLSIHPDRVNINRSGAIQMNQQFHLDQATEAMMELPHGNIHMETYTQSIKYESIRDNIEGNLMINYRMTLNGQTERDHKLRLTYHKEDAK